MFTSYMFVRHFIELSTTRQFTSYRSDGEKQTNKQTWPRWWKQYCCRNCGQWNYLV